MWQFCYCDHKMEVNRLLGDEIAHELIIRGLPVYNTVAENRITLRGALRLEREGLSTMVGFDIPLHAREEIAICQDKLDSLSEDIQNFDHSNKENEYKRISTRLGHVQNRLRRIRVEDQETSQERHDLLVRCLQLVDTLGNLKRNTGDQENILDQEHPPEGSILDQDNLLLPEVLPFTSRTTSEEQPEARNSTMIQTGLNLLEDIEHVRNELRRGNRELRVLAQPDHNRPTSNQILNKTVPLSQKERNSGTGKNHTELNQKQQQPWYNSATGTRMECNQEKLEAALRDIQIRLENFQPSCVERRESQLSTMHSDLSRWRIQFDGEASVTNFLERIEELRLSRGVSKSQLLRSAPELFTKDALHWFRTKDFDSWDDLVEQLKNDFKPYDYEFDLMEEIRRRTQGAKERVITYIAAMESLFKKLGSSKPEEQDRVKMIRRNLLPYLQSQLALQQTETISELTRLCKAVEETAIRTQKFVPPPTNYRLLLEPELAYRKSANFYSPSTSHQVSAVEPTSSSQPNCPISAIPHNNPLCWNCGGTGHKFRKCKQQKKIFCFRCGKDNVISSKCPCSKNLKLAVQ